MKKIKIAQWKEGLPDGYDVSDDVKNFLEEVDYAIVNAKEYELPEKMIENVNETKAEEPEFPEFPEFLRPLPKDKLTKSLKDLADITHNVSDTPDEFILPSFLAYWSGIVGNKVIGPNDLRTNVNIVLFAKSTNIRKSTSIKLAGTPFSEVQKKLDLEIKNTLAEYERTHSAWRGLPPRQRAQVPEPVPPVRRNIILSSDFSDAGFFVMTQNNPVSGIIVTGEYADYHKKLHRDITGMSDAMLLAYDNERMSRITRLYGEEIIDNPTFSILGATTFGNFRKVFSGGEKENGTLQRILPVVVLKSTKERRYFLNRSRIDESFIKNISEQINNWLDYDDEIEVVVSDNSTKLFNDWEKEFIINAKRDYGDEISPHAERMVASCLKIAMLCESLEIKNPSKLTSLELTNNSLYCAIAMINEVFLPSMGYLLKNEIIMNRTQYNCRLVEKIMKKAGGKIVRSELLRESNLPARELNEAILNLSEKECVKVKHEHRMRPQGGGNPKTIYTWIGN